MSAIIVVVIYMITAVGVAGSGVVDISVVVALTCVVVVAITAVVVVVAAVAVWYDDHRCCHCYRCHVC